MVNTIWTEPNDPLAYAPVLEHHHLIMSMLGGHRCRLDRGITILIQFIEHHNLLFLSSLGELIIDNC